MMIQSDTERSEADRDRPRAVALNEQGLQSSEWRRRLVEAILQRKFDDETLVTMLMAGFEQAHEEGLTDAAALCRDVAAGMPSASHVAGTLERSLRELIKRNKQIEIA